MSTQEELKKKYTQWIQCFYRGTKEMEELQTQINELEMQFKEKVETIQLKVLPVIDKYKKEIEIQGYVMTSEEILQGFGGGE